MESSEKSGSRVTTIDLSSMDRDEWLAWRKLGLGGSDAASVLGLSPWKSPLELYLEKRGELEDDKENERMKWGSLLEPIIATEYLSTRIDVKESLAGLGYIHPEYGFLLASPDRILDTETGFEILEVKASDAFAHRSWEEGEPPDNYLLQGHHYMMVTGLAVVHFAVLVGGNHLETFTLERDDQLIDNLLDAECTFWDNVVNGRPPAVDGSDNTKKMLNNFFNVIPDSTVELDSMYLATFAQIAAAKEEAKRIKDDLTRYENEIKLAMAENTHATIGGQIVATWKPQTRGAYYVEESSSRPLLPKKLKGA